MKCLINLLSDPSLKFERFEHGKYLGSTAEVAKLWDAKKLGFHVETLDPGTFSCPYHLHHEEEEMFIVLKGSAMVRQDGEFYEIKENDLVLFKTGSAHQFYNHTSSPFVFFALSNYSPDEICEYPDSRKKLNRKQKKLWQDGTEVEDYWKDEEEPQLKWPTEIINLRR